MKIRHIRFHYIMVLIIAVLLIFGTLVGCADEPRANEEAIDFSRIRVKVIGVEDVDEIFVDLTENRTVEVTSAPLTTPATEEPAYTTEEITEPETTVETEIETEEIVTAPPVEETIDYSYSDPDPDEVTILAKVIYCEARGIYSQTEQACIVWTILNRVDRYDSTIMEVVFAPNQFAYRAAAPTVDDYGRDLTVLVRDVLIRWEREKQGETDVGRVLPNDYYWYTGYGGHNWFRNTWEITYYWNYSLQSPYES